WDMQKWVGRGVVVALAEAGWRLREGFFRARQVGDTRLRGAIYGPLLLPLGALVTALAGQRGASSGVGFDGFYGGREHFDDKLEPARPYAQGLRLADRHD